MSIQVNMYDTSTLLGLYSDVPAPSRYFLDLLFPDFIGFDTEYIDFSKIKEGRKLAPLVIPTAQGRPVYDKAESVQRFTPAYLKPKDPVSPARLMKKRPGEGMFSQAQLSPEQRGNALIGDILREHRSTIERRWEWLAAQAIITGKVTLSAPDYPERIVDFGRANNHTVTLTSTAAWNDNGFTGSIMADLQTWINRVAQADFGGPVTRITVGKNVWPIMQKDQDLLKQLDVNLRGSNANLTTGLLPGELNVKIGNISPTIELWLATDYYEVNGSPVPFVPADTVVLTSPAVMGVQCFGAILDMDAQLNPLPVFPKMWKQEDPSAVFVMSQSAPLMVPVNPNATLAAKVLT